MIVAALLGGLGCICITLRRSLLGVLLGMQMLMLGATLLFVVAGSALGLSVRTNVLGLFALLGQVGLIVAGFALCIRLYSVKKSIAMDQLRSLKR